MMKAKHIIDGHLIKRPVVRKEIKGVIILSNKKGFIINLFIQIIWFVLRYEIVVLRYWDVTVSLFVYQITNSIIVECMLSCL